MALDATIAAVRDAAAAARGLPNEAYRDPEFFDLEQAQIFARHWTCVAAASELPAPGDHRPVSAAGQPLLLLRDRDGEARAFHNVCSHRGAQLVTAPGRGIPVIRCPYHSWAYGLDGSCLKTPNFGGQGVNDVADIDRQSLGLKPVRLAQWLDFLFVDLSGAAPPLDDWLAPLKARWAHYDLSLLRRFARLDFTLPGNWKLATENTMEFYHLPWVHKGLNRYSHADDHYHCNARDRFVGTASRCYAAVEIDGRGLPGFPGLSDEQRRVAEYPVVFPNLWLGVMGDHAFGLIVDPEAPARTREEMHLYVVGEAALAPDYAAHREALIERWRSINSEDIAIVELLQRGRASSVFDGGVLSPAQDFGARHFMRMVADCLGRP